MLTLAYQHKSTAEDGGNVCIELLYKPKFWTDLNSHTHSQALANAGNKEKMPTDMGSHVWCLQQLPPTALHTHFSGLARYLRLNNLTRGYQKKRTWKTEEGKSKETDRERNMNKEEKTEQKLCNKK